MDVEFFKRQAGGYVTNINPIQNYMNQAISLVVANNKISRTDAVKLVKSKIKAKGGVTDPMVTYRVRLDNDDREMVSRPLTTYISDVVKSKDIIVPSFTVYDNPTKRKSLHANFLAGNIAKRSKHKKLSLAAYQANDMGNFVKHDVLQKVMKIFNNSLSGAYASMSTNLYQPSSHYTLTSITRCVASIGNAVTESVVAGNKCFYTPESVINYITAIITIVDMKSVAAAMGVYKLVSPTPDEVMSMITYSSDRYWGNVDKKQVILDYLRKLDKFQLAAVMYVNDLFHLRKYNNTTVLDLVGGLATKVATGAKNPMNILSRDLEGVNNLAHHICMHELSGKTVRYKDLVEKDPELIMLLGSTAENIYRVLNKYKLLLKAFFITDVLPIDIANVKDCYRDVIVLSDTDSTCGSYDNWTHWYCGHDRFTPEAVGLSAAVMTINTQVMDHNIKVFAKNMNIAADSVELLKMKNEFFWSVFVTANVSKHYYANTWIREGNVYAESELELKGVHLIGSSTNQEIISAAHQDMRKLLEDVEKGNTIVAKDILTSIADLERTILTELAKGSVDVFKLDKIKESGAYKLDNKDATPYFHHVLWREIFAEVHGDPGEPAYMTVNIPTVLKSKKKLTMYLDSIPDEDIKHRLSTFLAEHGKTTLGTFRCPLSLTSANGVPREMLLAVDKHRVVLNNLNVYYIFLESLGIFRKKGLLFSEMGY